MTDTSPEDPIEHDSDGRHGAFFIRRDGRRVAELTYARHDGTAVVVAR